MLQNYLAHQKFLGDSLKKTGNQSSSQSYIFLIETLPDRFVHQSWLHCSSGFEDRVKNAVGKYLKH